ncbi:MAG: DNA repair exonuclease [Clostridia bacterium]|nr:DNA repair exonuclease [Clostridia bacterium]
MKSVRILHLSDLHLGRSFDFLDSVNARIRRQELLATFFKAISLCKDKDVDLLLIAGDFFESNNVDSETMIALRKVFSSIPDTRIFIALGNHDFMSADLFENYVNLENVHIFSSDWEKISIEELNVDVYGRSFGTSHIKRSFFNDFKFNVSDDAINIMVMHADIVDREIKSQYNPITIEQISKSDMDYIALGHMHKASKAQRKGKTSFAYSGSPEGLDLSETGKKGVYIGEIDKNDCKMEFAPINKRLVIRKEIDVSDCETNNDICHKILGLLVGNESKGNIRNFDKNMYDFYLVGKSDINIDTYFIKKKLEDSLFYCRVQENVLPDVDIKLLSSEQNASGIFTQNVLSYMLSNKDSYEAKRALIFGLKALNGEELKSED